MRGAGGQGRGGVGPLPEEEAAAAMYRRTHAVLEGRGYVHYEVLPAPADARAGASDARAGAGDARAGAGAPRGRGP